jgi:CHAD domain-containing protein
VVGEEARNARESLRHTFDEHDRERLIGALTQVAQELTAAEPTGRLHGSVRPASQLSAIDARVARRAGRLALAISNAGTLYAPNALHGVRIALKKLRYALEVFNEARAHDDAHMMALLRKMQQTLGRLHDLEMLAKRVRSTEAHAEEHLLEGLATFAERLEIERRELHSNS